LSVRFGQAILSAQATGLWARETSLLAGVNGLARSPWRAMDAQNGLFPLNDTRVACNGRNLGAPTFPPG